MQEANTEYEEARKSHDDAFEVYATIRAAYRNMEIGDDEFLAAKAEYDNATAEYDAAYAKANANAEYEDPMANVDADFDCAEFIETLRS